MAAMAGTSLQMATTRPCVTYSRKMFTSSSAVLGLETKGLGQVKLGSSSSISSVQPLQRSLPPAALKLNNVVTRAMASASGNSGPSGLPIDLRGNKFALCFHNNFSELSCHRYNSGISCQLLHLYFTSKYKFDS